MTRYPMTQKRCVEMGRAWISVYRQIGQVKKVEFAANYAGHRYFLEIDREDFEAMRRFFDGGEE